MTEILNQFLEVMEEVEEAAPTVFDTLGLIPTDPSRPSGYDQTPEGCATFAWTGGDGVHFSLVPKTDGSLDDAPVVMTVPMQFDRPNLVLGANLREFLALGVRSGYFVLEQIAYDADGTLAALAVGAYEADLSDDDRLALGRLRAAFDLEDWPEFAGRFQTLQAEFGAALIPSREE